MASYAASVSLQQTIHRLLDSSDHISIHLPSRESLHVAYEAARSLQKLLQHLDGSSFTAGGIGMLELEELLKSHAASKEVLESFRSMSYRGRGQRSNALDGKIREAASKLEDALENHAVNVILSQSQHDESRLGDESHDPSTIISMDLQELKQEIKSFVHRVKELEEECIEELFNPSPGEKGDEDDDFEIKPRADISGEKSKMVGMYDVFSQTKSYLVPRDGLKSTIELVSLVGMAGIGKTTLAKEVFADPSVMSRFDHRAFVSIGQKYQLRDILQSILNQVNPNTDRVVNPNTDRVLTLEDNGYLLSQHFYENLRFGRYLIVLDDVWDEHILQYLLQSFPYGYNGYGCDGFFRNYKILILLTTRLEAVGGSWADIRMLKLRFLDKEESWDLLRKRVFDGESRCPRQLVKSGKKIAENCDGLPLVIVTVAGFLSKAEKTLEHWNEVAERNNSICTDVYYRMSKVLFPSYEYLPRYLKTCFLYMAVFPQNYEIPIAKLSMLLNTEGCLDPIPKKPSRNKFLKDFALDYLEELVGNSVVLDGQMTHENKLKTCSLHSVFWHLCMRETGRTDFLHVLNTYDNAVAVGMKNQRRLCVHKNVLFGIKGVRKSISSSSTARSLLCTGPHHPYPVPICFGHFKLLRVIDALTVRFYEFPVEILKLVQLRYLALLYDGELPLSLSKLRNLQILIIGRYLSIIKPQGDKSSYLPMEIWDMKELKHLEIMGRHLLDPCAGTLMPNIETLLDMSAQSCTKSVLGGFPNLIKLGIRIELGPDATEPFSCFDHVSRLKQLRSLKCVIMNPELRSKVLTLPASTSFFPGTLQKLSLSGCGYPWEHMNTISSLPNLRSLKLRCYAFRGPKWETYDKKFGLLEYLHIEDTDLEHWIVRHGSFPRLKRLCLKHCYKLKAIPYVFHNYVSKIEVDECNLLVQRKE